jgi:hypothetical protein
MENEPPAVMPDGTVKEMVWFDADDGTVTVIKSLTLVRAAARTSLPIRNPPKPTSETYITAMSPVAAIRRPYVRTSFIIVYVSLPVLLHAAGMRNRERRSRRRSTSFLPAAASLAVTSEHLHYTVKPQISWG